MSRNKKDPGARAGAPAEGEPEKTKALEEEELKEVSGGVSVEGWMSVTAKTSEGVSVSFPDVCQTPTSPSPVPLPYPTTTSTGDTASGTKKTKTDG